MPMPYGDVGVASSAHISVDATCTPSACASIAQTSWATSGSSSALCQCTKFAARSGAAKGEPAHCSSASASRAELQRRVTFCGSAAAAVAST